MSSKFLCQIQCQQCNEWFDSPSQYDSANNFFNSVMSDSPVKCPKCNLEFICKTDSMRFIEDIGNGISRITEQREFIV